MNDERGSLWRKWDLHVHTPASIEQKYGGGTEESWQKFVGDLENLPSEFKVIDSIAAIEDSNRLEELDTRQDYGEDRMRIIGMAAGNVLVVVTTFRGDRTCRIISARRATRNEQDRYYTGDREAW